MEREILEKMPGLETESSSTRRTYLRTSRDQVEIFFEGPDPSIYMLDLPKSLTRFQSWFVLAVLAGTVLALSIIYITNL